MSDDRSRAYGQSATDDDSARIKFRRALTLVLMTLVLPGSAQLVMGNKRVGRIAIRIWIVLWAGIAFLVVLGLTSRTSAFSLVTNTTLLWLARMIAIAVALGWAALFADAWRLGSPLELRRGHRLAMTGVNSVLCFVTAGSLFFGAHIMSVQQDFIASVFGGTTVSSAQHGRYNVLLLGGDSGSDRWGLRSDSMTVASVDADTGRTVLIALPRNLKNAPFPAGSPMDKKFPHGFDCGDCYLNSVNTWVEDHKSQFPGIKHPGLEATKDTIEEITGLKINYYAMINLHGFESLVDAVGGVRLHVPERVPIGGIGAPITGYVPKGTHKLDGKQTLWFARSRVANNDYSRMARQKCVMSAMVQQLNPQKVLFNVQKIASTSKKMLSTDIPKSELGTFMNLALKARSEKISTVSIVPPVINTSDPDFPKIRTMVTNGIEKSEHPGKAGKGTSTTKKSGKHGKSKQQSDPDKQRSAGINNADDLASSC